MDVNRFGVVWARSAHPSASDQFSIGGLVSGDQTSADWVTGLIETLAYIGDVLSSKQDQVAAEGFLSTTYDDQRDVLRVDMRAGARPIVCVVIDDCRASWSASEPKPTRPVLASATALRAGGPHRGSRM